MQIMTMLNFHELDKSTFRLRHLGASVVGLRRRAQDNKIGWPRSHHTDLREDLQNLEVITELRVTIGCCTQFVKGSVSNLTFSCHMDSIMCVSMVRRSELPVL